MRKRAWRRAHAEGQCRYPNRMWDPAPVVGGVLSQMRVGAGEVQAAKSKRPGGVTEWLMVADCKSAGLTPYVGSNPTPTMETGAGRSRV